ncbi:helix-turn-helix transcriptional regulator [Paenibacillus arenilitoris]|uniref:Transcriptional regulator n=1 Tax=Paenibacillus arenilitoris TaxID=2772299 RepID=A0A927CHY4_9BACL|nr:metalloregulator ArsR/SmtB family transcription factor [Paenibacillus arenilitoris]MBD2866948.1 transcriptional regulator [Paenibacillus arenilitoris]
MKYRPGRDGATRQKIVELYKKHGRLTIREIAGELGLTGMAVRRHVHQLQADGYLEIACKRGHAHRPAMVYQLTSKASNLFPEQYGNLAVELLESLQELGGEDAIRLVFLRLKEKLNEELLLLMSSEDLEERLYTLASYQDKRGYMTSLYRSDDAMWILEEANCPILQVAASFRHACQCEMALFAEVLGAKVQRLECMAEGRRTCKYRIME